MKIHPAAVVSSDAEIGKDVEIGPLCVVESGAVIGEGCKLEAGCVIKSGTALGRRNHVFEGAVLGGLPQHLHCPERPGRLIVGDDNKIRENVTAHRALEEDKATLIGDGNLLMVNAHVAHDCVIGNHVVITNNVMLAGHVEVQDRAYLAGGAAVHQFCRIGRLAMVGGLARVKKDVPPFVMIDGHSGLVVGLNLVGLKRSGFDADDIRQLKEVYRITYRRGLKWQDVLRTLEAEVSEGPAMTMVEFFQGGTRGFTPERRIPRDATIRLPSDEEEPSSELRVKAG